MCGTVETEFLKNRFLANACPAFGLIIGFHKQIIVCRTPTIWHCFGPPCLEQDISAVRSSSALGVGKKMLTTMY